MDMHTFRPLDRKALEKFEVKYADWLQFMRGHKEGRWCSTATYGTQKCEDSNSMEEDMGPIWDWWMKHTRSCVKGTFVSKKIKKGQISFTSLGASLHGTTEKTKTPYTVENLRAQFEQDPKFMININDDMPMNEEEVEQTGITYEAALKAQTEVLEEQFPAPLPAVARQ